MKQKQDDISNVEMAGLTTRKNEKTLDRMLNAIGDSLSDLARSNNEANTYDEQENEDTEQGKLSEHDEPGWVMGTVSKMVQRRMQMFGSSRWILANWCNQDGEMRPTTSVIGIRSMESLNSMFQHSMS